MRRLYFLIFISILIIFTTSYSGYKPVSEAQIQDIFTEQASEINEQAETVKMVLPQPDNTESAVIKYNYTDILRFIREQCFIVGVNYSFAVSLLREETPLFFSMHEESTSQEFIFENRRQKNNGTSGYGLWQINGNKLWTSCVPKFWHNLDEFDWKNPYHNTYIAIRYINWLHVSIQKHHIDTMNPQNINTIYWKTAMAYCDNLERVIGNAMSAAALDYAVKVIERVF